MWPSVQLSTGKKTLELSLERLPVSPFTPEANLDNSFRQNPTGLQCWLSATVKTIGGILPSSLRDSKTLIYEISDAVSVWRKSAARQYPQCTHGCYKGDRRPLESSRACFHSSGLLCCRLDFWHMRLYWTTSEMHTCDQLINFKKLLAFLWWNLCAGHYSNFLPPVRRFIFISNSGEHLIPSTQVDSSFSGTLQK